MDRVKKVWVFLRRDKRRLWTAIVLAIILLVVVVGYFINRGKAKVNYQTAEVMRGNIVSTISASGSIVSSNVVEVATSVGGIVKNVYVTEGQSVYLGQKIAQLELNPSSKQEETSSYASYLAAKSSLDSANSTLYTLQSQLFSANQKFINDAVARNLETSDPTYIQENADWLASEAKYKNQQTAISQAKASFSSAALKYRQSSSLITSPAGGTLKNITITPGLTMTTSTNSSGTVNAQRIAVVDTGGNPIGSFNLSEVDVASVKVGQKATITIDSLPDKTFTGVVATVDKIGSVTSNVTNYPALVVFDTEAPDVSVNMAATVNIIQDSKDNVLLVPISAIQKSGTQNTVRILKNGKVSTLNVEVGLSSDSQIEIVSGLSQEDSVVISSSEGSSTSSSSSRSVFGGGGGFGGAVRIAR